VSVLVARRRPHRLRLRRHRGPLRRQRRRNRRSTAHHAARELVRRTPGLVARREHHRLLTPRLHPDGRLPVHDLPDGANERKLTSGTMRTFGPSYSPDGTKIVFYGASQMYAMNADGSGVTPLVAGEGIQPAWGTSTGSPVVTPPDAPRVQILSPPVGALLLPGQQVPAWYTCDSFISFVVSCVGNVPLGAPLDSSTAGTKQLTVTATDVEGRQAVASVTYTVLDVTAPSTRSARASRSTTPARTGRPARVSRPARAARRSAHRSTRAISARSRSRFSLSTR
jgi:hypothetical protein